MGIHNVALEIKCHPPNSRSQDGTHCERATVSIPTMEMAVPGGHVLGVSKEDASGDTEVEERVVDGIDDQTGV